MFILIIEHFVIRTLDNTDDQHWTYSTYSPFVHLHQFRFQFENVYSFHLARSCGPNETQQTITTLKARRLTTDVWIENHRMHIWTFQSWNCCSVITQCFFVCTFPLSIGCWWWLQSSEELLFMTRVQSGFIFTVKLRLDLVFLIKVRFFSTQNIVQAFALTLPVNRAPYRCYT